MTMMMCNVKEKHIINNQLCSVPQLYKDFFVFSFTLTALINLAT